MAGQQPTFAAVYQPHPSAELNELFRQRPFQGVPPEKSEFLFVGLDANYAAELHHTAYHGVLAYHRDGVDFWRRHGVHHPFLLEGYNGSGRRYHRNFSRIGFKAADAHRISFVELLHVPTVGRNKLEVADLDSDHLKKLGDIISSGECRYEFVSAEVVKLMNKTKRFEFRPRAGRSEDVLPELYRKGKTSVRLHLHFSNYGKFQACMDRQAMAIAKLAANSPCSRREGL